MTYFTKLFFMWFATMILLGIATSQVVYGEARATEWVGSHPTFTKQKDISYDDYRASGTMACTQTTTYKKVWVSGWNSYLTDRAYNGCLVSMLDGYVDITNSGVLLYGNRYNYSLSNYDASVTRTIGEDYIVYPVENTSHIAFVGFADGDLHITDNYRHTFGKFQKNYETNVFMTRNHDYDFTLKDTQGRLMRVSRGTIAFSGNGQWMIASLSNYSWVRINIATGNYEILPFAEYRNLNGYGTVQAISQDGRFVALYEPSQALRVYDLEKCQSAGEPFVSRQCESYALSWSDMMSQFQSQETHIGGLTFLNTGTLEATIANNRDGAWRYERYRIVVDEAESPVRYLALGDSFSSGEGALAYRSVTDFFADENNYNLCHQSTLSYSYLLNTSLRPEWFGSIACSGAVQGDVVSTLFTSTSKNIDYLKQNSQAKTVKTDQLFIDNVLNNVIPGYIIQSSYIPAKEATVATISIGGNDIGFADIVTACTVNKFFRNMQACNTERADREQIANTIDAQIAKLTTTFKTIKQQLVGPQKLYVIGYPKLVNYSNVLCSLNTPLSPVEREFADTLVDYLNGAIQVAANQAGVRFVDVADAFVNPDHDYRLCGNTDRQAMNGLMMDQLSMRKPGELVAHESFHPNQLGHTLLAQRIRLLTNDFSLDMPEPVKTNSVTSDDLRRRLVGDTVVTYPNQKINYITDSIPSLLIGASNQMITTIQNAPGVIMDNISALVELHSTPTPIGHMTVTPDNTIVGIVSLPETVSAGYHQLHILYTDSAGQEYDMYRYVLVIKSLDDYDGDGIQNDKEVCVVGDGAGVDSDKDGIDDACDGEYILAATGTTDVHDNTMSSGVAARSVSSYSTSEHHTMISAVDRIDRNQTVAVSAQSPPAITQEPPSNVSELVQRAPDAIAYRKTVEATGRDVYWLVIVGGIISSLVVAWFIYRAWLLKKPTKI